MQPASHTFEECRAALRLPPAARRVSRPAVEATHRYLKADDLGPLREAYLHRGGLVSGEVAVGLLRGHADQPLSQLARWIVAGEVVSVEDSAQTLIPLFQFDPQTMSIRPEAREVIAALSGAFDGREMADWFVRPNDWLDGALPIDALERDAAAVAHAARADRFVATGWA